MTLQDKLNSLHRVKASVENRMDSIYKQANEMLKYLEFQTALLTDDQFESLIENEMFIKLAKMENDIPVGILNTEPSEVSQLVSMIEKITKTRLVTITEDEQ